MNKLIFSLLLLFLVLPLFIFAQGMKPPKECCKLRTKVDLGTLGSCDKDEIAAATSNPLVVAECGTTSDLCNTSSAWAMFCLMGSIVSVTNWIFYVLTMIVTIMVIYGGFNIVTSSGDPKKMETGRKILTFALIGLALALLAKFLPSIVKFFLGL